MKAVVFPGDKRVEVVDRPVPQPGRNEVLIQTRASALCRSDMSIYYGDPIVGSATANSNLVIPGHEPAGVVVDIGSDVSSIKQGDRVAVHLAIGCGDCAYCRKGYEYLCPDWKCLGFDVDGGDADYLVVPARNCLKLPEGMSFEVGAVSTDMIGTQYEAQRRLGVSGTSTVAVVGMGPMGAAGVLVAKARGARVIAVDILQDRLDLALEFGADEVVNSKETNPVETLRELSGVDGVDMAIDCSGSPIGQNTALDAIRPFGSAAFIGESRVSELRPSDQLIRKLSTVIGAWYFPIWEWPEIARFIEHKKIPVEKMITHHFSIDEAPKAFEMFDQRLTEKSVIVWD